MDYNAEVRNLIGEFGFPFVPACWSWTKLIFCAINLTMKEEVHKQPEFNFPKVISLGSENSNETKKLTAEEQLKKSLLEGTLKTNIRLAPESRITKNNPENQS